MSLPSAPSRRASRTPRVALRLALTCVLGVGAALVVGCGSSSKGLISASAAGPLKSDIEAVDLAAQEGNGNCTATNSALQRTEQDFASLPAPPSTDAGLHNTLRQGIANLRKVATELCTQPLAKTATTTTPTATTPTTSTSTTKTTPPKEEKAKEEERAKEKEAEETEVRPGPGGGTPAPGEGNGKPPSEGVGGAGAEEGTGNGVGGQESK